MLKWIPQKVDSISESIARKTKPFVESRLGKAFLAIVLVGPLTFTPQLYEAWTAPNIDALRTWTWPLMVVVNMSSLLSLIHNGDWRMRLVVFIWITIMSILCAVILIR